MNKKLFRTVFAVFLAVFMCGTSVNPAVFAIDNEPETLNETEELKTEESDDAKKVIAEFVIGEDLIPAEAEDADALPGILPAKLETDESVDVAVEWTEEENALTVDLTDESEKTYTLSNKAEGQLKGISVKKTETEEQEEEAAPAEETGSDEPVTQPEIKEDEMLVGEQKRAEGEDAEINKSDDNLSENSSREGRTEEADLTKKTGSNESNGDKNELS